MNASLKKVLLFIFITTFSIVPKAILSEVEIENEALNALFENNEKDSIDKKEDSMSDDTSDDNASSEESNQENERISSQTYKQIKLLSDQIVPLLSSSTLTTKDELNKRFNQTVKALLSFKKKAKLQVNSANLSAKPKSTTNKNMQNLQALILSTVNQALKNSNLKTAAPAPAQPPKTGDLNSSNMNMSNIMGAGDLSAMPQPMPSPIPSTPAPMPTMPAPMPSMPAPMPSMPTPAASFSSNQPREMPITEDPAITAEIDKMIAETMQGM